MASEASLITAQKNLGKSMHIDKPNTSRAVALMIRVPGFHRQDPKVAISGAALRRARGSIVFRPEMRC